ncbi:hypothetical protein HJC23_004795 [Cyclotella cryptica]|uniref:Uncharacterized protein n=1 Tax=Cyclotella cryptica TaxID=29204 RepID=A0ABD3Q3L8_9STRA
MKRSPSPLDCQSIGQSLKRVKISTSPGELRLDRDIELLLSSKTWTSTENNSPNGGRINEISSQNARLVRDPVDPLRLRLTVLRSMERWMFLIQMPRMYPHVPPVVTRVSRDAAQENLDGWMGGHRSLTAAEAMVASSVMQRAEPPVPERVVIRALPPSRAGDVCTSQCDDWDMEGCGDPYSEDNSPLLEIDAATAVYRCWSPVSSLGELIEFLMGIPEKRRQWWSIESNRRGHLQSLRSSHFLAAHPTLASSQYNPNVTIKVTKYPLKAPQNLSSPMKYHKAQYPSSPCDMDADKMDLESAIEGSPFVTNRFDVGYERGSFFQRWGVR